ncbi:MAG: hypothetical protein JWM27_1020 [Gemmatimonadetes bacterium]|nr:hypothetical protein [Gemmatimonadota bacterium]
MQKKLTLDVETLSIDSFPTTPEMDEKERGTVMANATPCTFNFSGCKATFHTCASFDVSC